MSRENVEIVRRHFTAWRGDAPETALAYMAREVEFDTSSNPGGTVWRGWDGARQGMVNWLGAWKDYTAEIDEIVDMDHRVVVLWRESGHAKRTGTPVVHAGATVVTIKDGMITSMRLNFDRKATLADLGLAE